MRKSFRGKNKNQKSNKEFRVNERIFAPNLMIIDEEGKNLGVMNKNQALTEARRREFDLVEVFPKADPPIAKFLDYGNFKYQKEKQERKQKSKQKSAEIKTIKISTRISEHDLDFRVNQATKFLTEGNKVKIELQLRGREHQHVDLAKENINKTIEKISQGLKDKTLKIEQPINKQGGRLTAVISL